MPYLLGGKNIRTLVETEPTSGPRNSTELGNSKYLFGGKTHQTQYNEKIIADYDGYMYSGDAGLKSKFLRAGSAYFTVAKKGNRPCPTYPRRRWQSSTPATYWVNKFSDGEVWVSTTYGSRTGTRISTAAENINYIFVMLIGPGGGGGGGSGTKAGGGGGGGAFAYLCHKLVLGWANRLYMAAGGAGGAKNENGSSGINCQFAAFRDYNDIATSGVTTVNATGGIGGRSGGNDGVGGSGGTASSYDTNDSYIHRLDERTGTKGGNRGGNAGGSTPAYNTQAYTPENNRLDYGQGAGGQSAGGSGSGGGGGWFYGHNGGNATSGGVGQDGGIGAGGGSGAYLIFSGYAGGKGGNSYAAIFY